jgi:hypothetical protein
LPEHLGRLEEEGWWDSEAERLGGLEVDHQPKLYGLFHGQIGRFGAFEDLVDIAGGTFKESWNISDSPGFSGKISTY